MPDDHADPEGGHQLHVDPFPLDFQLLSSALLLQRHQVNDDPAKVLRVADTGGDGDRRGRRREVKHDPIDLRSEGREDEEDYADEDVDRGEHVKDYHRLLLCFVPHQDVLEENE